MISENYFPEPQRPQSTGRYVVRFAPDMDIGQAQALLANRIGIRALDVREAGDASMPAPGREAPEGGLVVGRFNVAVIQPQDQVGPRIASLAAEDGVIVRPEFYLFAIGEMERRYSAWVREGLSILLNAFPNEVSPHVVAAAMAAKEAPADYADTHRSTWGLSAVGADTTQFTGQGVRAAVLDTGLDFDHPDFVGRPIVSRSFVPDGSVQDVHGHGTHTAGTFAGPAESKIGRRYGVAPDVDLYIGKVLNDSGAGTEIAIFQALNWAIEQRCAVVSMSLGWATRPEDTYDPVYETIGTTALKAGTLIVAAAGNESARDYGYIAPIGAPANAPSILAVGAVDPTLKVAPFSCGAVNDDGTKLDLVGPGVSVYSASPRPRLSRTLQGTSMACPHVAGLAALLASSDASLRGRRLWDALVAASREVGPARDYGSGLAQLPRSAGA